MPAKKERKASAAKPDHRDRSEWPDRPDQSACRVLKATKAMPAKTEHEASAAKRDHRARLEWLDRPEWPDQSA